MKLINSLLLAALMVFAFALTSCNEEPVTSVAPGVNTSTISKLTLPEGAIIQSATFNIYVELARDRDINVHKVNVPWDEATETWNIFHAKSSPQFEAVPEGDFSAATTGYKSVDITSLVQGWIADPTTNQGVLLDQIDAWPFTTTVPFIRYYSKENAANLPSYLEVTYTVGGGDPVTKQEPALEDTYIASPEDLASTRNGGATRLFHTRVAAEDPTQQDYYVKYVLVKFDIESTPALCYQEETAWAANYQTPLQLRYTNRGNWATYVKYQGFELTGKTVNVYAGQTNLIGTAQFSGVDVDKVTITINLTGDWELNPDTGEAVKIQDYATEPSGNPAPGLFAHKGNSLVVEVPANNFYGVHLDVRLPVDCVD